MRLFCAPDDVCDCEVDHEGHLHHVAAVPLDVLVPHEHGHGQEEEEDADAQGDWVENGQEVFVDLVLNRQVVVVADVICEIINAIVVVVFIDEVSVAYAELVVVPGEVSLKRLFLVHVSYVFPTKSSIRQDCVATSIPVWVSVQRVLYKWLGAVEA